MSRKNGLPKSFIPGHRDIVYVRTKLHVTVLVIAPSLGLRRLCNFGRNKH